MSRPLIISTMKPLPFGDLSYDDFERMTLWLVECEGYRRARHLGRGGSEQGRDVVAYKATESGDELWYFQCKRYKRIDASTLKKEVDKYVELAESDASKRPSGIVIVTNAVVTARVSDAVEKYSRDRGFRIDFWARTELDMRVKKHPDIVRQFFHAAAPAVSVSPESKELELLLGNVKDAWLREGLDEPVPESRRIALELEEQPGAVESGFGARQKTPAVRSLLSSQTVLDLFLKRRRSLLILGDTGSGKTTTLLLLAEGLAARAGTSPGEPPIPVVFNLSTWSAQQPPLPLSKWLFQQMKDVYQAPEKAQTWLDEHQILPLLDGLDEVDSACWAACVDAINEWLNQNGNGLHGLAVCCSTPTHKKLLELPQPRRLQLATAVSVQTLSTAQIGWYIAVAPGGKALGAVLEGDPDLKELAKNPQLLDIMREICEDAGGEALAESAGGPLEVRSRRLFEKYIDLRLELRESRRFPRKRTLHYVIWLARQMEGHSSSLFQLEQLQPTWLPTRAEPWRYFLVTRTLAGGLLLLPLVLIWRSWPLLLYGLPAGFLAGIVDARLELRRRDAAGQSIGIRQGLFRTILYAVVTLLPLYFAVEQADFKGYVFGPLLALLFGLVFGLRSAERDATRDIQAAEKLDWSGWSWKGAQRGAIAGGLAGLIPLLGGSLIGTGFFLLAGFLVGGLLGALQGQTMPERPLPNQGMWRTLQNAAVLFVAVSLVTCLVAGALILALRLMAWKISPWLAPFLGSTFGLWVALWFSGLDVLQHYVLRILLALSKYTPVRYVHFLNYAAASGLLLKIGGSYRFRYGPMQAILASRPEGKPDAQSLGIARSASS